MRGWRSLSVWFVMVCAPIGAFSDPLPLYACLIQASTVDQVDTCLQKHNKNNELTDLFRSRLSYTLSTLNADVLARVAPKLKYTERTQERDLIKQYKDLDRGLKEKWLAMLVQSNLNILPAMSVTSLSSFSSFEIDTLVEIFSHPRASEIEPKFLEALDNDTRTRVGWALATKDVIAVRNALSGSGVGLDKSLSTASASFAGISVAGLLAFALPFALPFNGWEVTPGLIEGVRRGFHAGGFAVAAVSAPVAVALGLKSYLVWLSMSSKTAASAKRLQQVHGFVASPLSNVEYDNFVEAYEDLGTFLLEFLQRENIGRLGPKGLTELVGEYVAIGSLIENSDDFSVEWQKLDHVHKLMKPSPPSRLANHKPVALCPLLMIANSTGD